MAESSIAQMNEAARPLDRRRVNRQPGARAVLLSALLHGGVVVLLALQPPIPAGIPEGESRQIIDAYFSLGLPDAGQRIGAEDAAAVEVAQALPADMIVEVNVAPLPVVEPPPEPEPAEVPATVSQADKPAAPQKPDEASDESSDQQAAARASQGDTDSDRVGDTRKKGAFERVRSRWLLPPQMTPELTCRIRVVLDEDGQILSVEIARSSGNRVFDDSVVRAVYKSNPFPVQVVGGETELMLEFDLESLL